jgi:hypothetical protein
LFSHEVRVGAHRNATWDAVPRRLPERVVMQSINMLPVQNVAPTVFLPVRIENQTQRTQPSMQMDLDFLALSRLSRPLIRPPF